MLFKLGEQPLPPKPEKPQYDVNFLPFFTENQQILLFNIIKIIKAGNYPNDCCPHCKERMSQKDFSALNGAGTTSADRMRAHREKIKLISQNAYVKPILESAKDALKSMIEPSVEALAEDPEFGAKLDAAQLASLKVFVKNLKAAKKKQDSLCQEKVKEEVNFREKAQLIGNIEITELDKVLLAAQSEDERISVMLKSIEENIYVFCEYMEILRPKTEDFLKHIVGFHDILDERQFTMLFVRVCVLYRGEALSIKPEMIHQTMKFLVDAKAHPTAALGLLRLSFENQIEFTEFSLDLLLRFQALYENQFIHFIKGLQKVRQHITDSLPPTIFIFAKPMMRSLHNGGDCFYRGMPPQFIPYLVSIVSHSFNQSFEKHDELLMIFKDGCYNHYDSLGQSDFQNLLQTIIDLLRQRHSKFFKNTKAICSAISTSFDLLSEKKIVKFDIITVNQILNGGVEALTMLQQRPRICTSTLQSNLDTLLNKLVALNPQIPLDVKELTKPLDAVQLRPFHCLGISALLPIQEVAFKILLGLESPSKTFIRYETGQGKTALCLAYGLIKAHQGERVVIVNQSHELTFRDFKKALSAIKEFPVSASILDKNGDLTKFAPGIIYMNAEDFCHSAKQLSIELLTKTTIVIDEFDSIIFREAPNQVEQIQALISCPNVIGLSGSDFQFQHQSLITNQLAAELINFSVQCNDKDEAVCKSINIFEKKAEAINALVTVALSQTHMTPIIFILENGHDQLQRVLAQKSIRTENLNGKDGPQIDAALGTFTLKSQSRFPAFLINQDQGRGLDFGTCASIEENGGVYLIIASLPPNFLQYKQFLGRTSRVGNKGQFSIILHHKEVKNMDSVEFFKKKLEELKNQDIQSVSRLAQYLQEKNCINSDINMQGAVKSINIGGTLQTGEKIMPEEISKPAIIFDQGALSDFAEADTPDYILTTIGDHGGQEKAQSVKSVDALQSKRRKTKEEAKQEQTLQRQAKKLERLRVDRDFLYFQGYSLPDIHREMTEDEQRMTHFQKAIAMVSSGALVIDIGAGSGVLCIMAAKAGAQKVYGVEFSDSYKAAQQSVIDNKLEGTIQIVHELAEKFILPDGMADVLISEWMGYFLIFENMLPSVLAAKELNLKEGGKIIPKSACLKIAAFAKPEEVHGIVLRSIEKLKISEPSIEILQPGRVLTEPGVILALDIEKLSTWKNEFSHAFALRATTSGVAKGIVSWFDAELTEDVILSTSPFAPPTHWKQTVMYFGQEVAIEEGEMLVGNIFVRPMSDDHRGLEIQLEVNIGEQQKPLKHIYWLQ